MNQTDAISRSRVLSTLEAEKGRLIAQKGNDWLFAGESLAKAVDTVIDFIKWIPALDAVPVLRCKGCALRAETGFCYKHAHFVTDEFFCAHGTTEEPWKKKEVEKDGHQTD